MRCTERLCSGAGASGTLSGRGSWARGVGLALISAQRCWLCGRGMFQDWELDLAAARSAGWAFWAESWASGTSGALGKDMQLGKGSPSSGGDPGVGGRLGGQSPRRGAFGRLCRGCVCRWALPCRRLLPGRCRCRPADSQRTGCRGGRPLGTTGCCCRGWGR